MRHEHLRNEVRRARMVKNAIHTYSRNAVLCAMPSHTRGTNGDLYVREPPHKMSHLAR